MQACRASRGLAPVVLTLSVLGCRDTGTKAENLVKDQSTVSVSMVADPSEAYRNVRLFIKQVDVKAGPTWRMLAKPERAFDLQPGGNPEQTLAKGVRLPRGSYDHVRFIVDSAQSTVTLPDGTDRPLGVPGTLKDGLLFAVQEGPSPDNLVQDLILNLDLARSVRRTADAHLLAPVATLNDRGGLGILAGRLVDAKSQPLKDVPVMAQDGSGALGRTLVRTVRTKADGTYRLDLLPVGRMYYVVAQPQAGGTLYAAQASPGLKLARLDRKKTFDFPPFQPVTAAPGPQGTVTQPIQDHQFDDVELLAHLVTGERQGDFIIRTAHAVPAAGGKSTYQFKDVPAGRYDVRLVRATLTPGDDSPRLDVLLHRPVEAGGDQAKALDF